MRVLLVEDDEMIGQSLKQALGANGWSVDWVKDGALAISALGDGDYACVLLDRSHQLSPDPLAARRLRDPYI